MHPHVEKAILVAYEFLDRYGRSLKDFPEAGLSPVEESTDTTVVLARGLLALEDLAMKDLHRAAAGGQEAAMSPGAAQQARHMAEAACGALGLVYETTSPDDLRAEIGGLWAENQALTEGPPPEAFAGLLENLRAAAPLDPLTVAVTAATRAEAVAAVTTLLAANGHLKAELQKFTGPPLPLDHPQASPFGTPLCGYCGWVGLKKPVAESRAEIIDHARACPAHPLFKAYAAFDQARELFQAFLNDRCARDEVAAELAAFDALDPRKPQEAK